MHDSYNERNTFQEPRPLCRPAAKVAQEIPFGRPKSHFCKLLANFLPIKKTSPNIFFRKLPKISKIEPEVAKGFHFGSFWMTLGIPFSIFVPGRLNLLISIILMRKLVFYYFRPPILASKIKKTNVSLPPLIGPHFSFVFSTVSETCRFWDPLQNTMGSKMAPKIDKRRQNGAQKTPRGIQSCRPAPRVPFRMLLGAILVYL